MHEEYASHSLHAFVAKGHRFAIALEELDEAVASLVQPTIGLT